MTIWMSLRVLKNLNRVTTSTISPSQKVKKLLLILKKRLDQECSSQAINEHVPYKDSCFLMLDWSTLGRTSVSKTSNCVKALFSEYFITFARLRHF